MMSSVPQFIDVEDKIVGPLTWKQLLWMIGMGGVLLAFFSYFDVTLFIIVGVPTALLFVALAFYKPNGFPLTTFIFYAVLFLFRPKVAVWKKTVNREQSHKEPVQTRTDAIPAPIKHMDREQLAALARILDGREGK